MVQGINSWEGDWKKYISQVPEDGTHSPPQLEDLTVPTIVYWMVGKVIPHNIVNQLYFNKKI